MTGILVAASLTAAAASDRWTETGLASWYGPGFAGKPTASSEIYDPNAMTAAHKTLPLGTLVRVENLENSRTVIVRINDRGPFKAGRIIDVSRAAAKVLDFHDDGLVEVRIEVIGHQYPSKTTTLPVIAAQTGAAVSVASAANEDAVAPVAENRGAEDAAVLGGVSFGASGPGFTEESLPAPATAAAAPAAAAAGAAPAAESPSSSPAEAVPAVASPAGATATDASSAADTPAAAAGEEHYLQIGKFDQEKNAWPVLHKVQALGLNGQVQDADGKFRAVVGPFKSITDARDAQTRLKEAGIDSFVRNASR